MLAKCLYENGDKYAQAFNFGANDDGNLTVKDFLQRFINVYGKGVIVDDEEGKFFEYDRLILNSDKAKNLLGWTPTLNIDKTIDFTVEWYKKFYADKDDMFDVTMYKERGSCQNTASSFFVILWLSIINRTVR